MGTRGGRVLGVLALLASTCFGQEPDFRALGRELFDPNGCFGAGGGAGGARRLGPHYMRARADGKLLALSRLWIGPRDTDGRRAEAGFWVTSVLWESATELVVAGRDDFAGARLERWVLAPWIRDEGGGGDGRARLVAPVSREILFERRDPSESWIVDVVPLLGTRDYLVQYRESGRVYRVGPGTGRSRVLLLGDGKAVEARWEAWGLADLEGFLFLEPVIPQFPGQRRMPSKSL